MTHQAPPQSRPQPTKSRPLTFDAAKAYIVRSLNATANKPLHVGHLRNATLGAATAASLRSLGAPVLRHCVVEDTGRFMSEAMVAYAELVHAGQGAPGGVKSDHFIGGCYAAYRRRNPRNTKAATGYEARNDAADEMLRALQRGEREAREIWESVRRMALEGQQATLRRAGLAFDCCDYESAEDDVLDEFIADGTARGLFVRNDSGEVVFTAANGQTLRLINAAGLAEESARLLSFIRRLLSGWPGDRTNVIMAGTEWQRSMSLYAEVLQKLGVRYTSRTYAQAFYGMVMIDGKKMASSIGSGVLVDTLLDLLAESRGVAELVSRSSGRFGESEAAAMILKAFLLAYPRRARIDFTNELLTDTEANPGWDLARAWAALPPAPPSEAPSPRVRELVVDAVSRVSYEEVLTEARSLARRIAAADTTAEDDRDFRDLVHAVALEPARSDFSYDRAIPLTAQPLAAPSFV